MKLSIDRHSKRKWDETILDVELSDQLTRFIESVKGDWERFLREDKHTLNSLYSNKLYSDNLIQIKSKFIIKDNDYAKIGLFKRFEMFILKLLINSRSKKS